MAGTELESRNTDSRAEKEKCTFVSTWCEFCNKTYLMNKYSGLLLSTFIHVSTISRFLYIQYMIDQERVCLKPKRFKKKYILLPKICFLFSW